MIGLLPALLPALGALLAPLPAVRTRAVALLGLVAAADAALALALAFGSPPDVAVSLGGGWFTLDATSRLFLLVIDLVFLGVAAYLWTRVRDTPGFREGIERLVALALAFMAAATLAILSAHLVAAWALLEVTTLVAVPMIQHRGSAARLRASWTYFLFSTIGLALAALGLACIARGLEEGGAAPGLFLDALAGVARRPPGTWARLGIALVLLGYGTKLGLAPMYTWLPETYHAGPPAVTVLLAAVQFNVALVALLRVLQVFGPAGQGIAGPVLVTLGLATMAASALGIVVTRNYTRLIAHAALTHGGVIAIGLGVGPAAAYGVVLYAVSNAFIKSILFLTAGKIEAHYGTEDVREVSGLLQDMPYSGLFFTVGTFALLGLPPFGSFLGELVIMSGLFATARYAVFAAFGAVLTVTFVATGRAVFPMIWGEPRRRVDWASQPLPALLPKLFFLACLVAMGIYLPAPVSELFRRVAASVGGG